MIDISDEYCIDPPYESISVLKEHGGTGTALDMFTKMVIKSNSARIQSHSSLFIVGKGAEEVTNVNVPCVRFTHLSFLTS